MNEYYPGTACLIEKIDKKLLVVLRDGRTLVGHLRSIDQFANLVLHKTLERIHVGKKYGDLPRGVFLIRGENVVLLGEIDETKVCNVELTKVSVVEILQLQEQERVAAKKEDDLKKKLLQDKGEIYVRTDPLQDDFF